MLLHIKAWIILTPLSFSPNTHKHSVSICQHSAVNSLTFNYTLSQVCSSAPLITEYCMLYDTVHVHKCLYIKDSIFHLYWPGWFYPPKPPPPPPSCIWAESGSLRRLNGVCLLQALGVDSLLWMQWERWLCEQRQPPPHAGWLTEQTPSCTLITQHQWFSVLSLQNSGIANVILCSESFFLSEVSFFSSCFVLAVCLWQNCSEMRT